MELIINPEVVVNEDIEVIEVIQPIVKVKKNPYRDDPVYKAKHLARLNQQVHCETCKCNFIYANKFRHDKSVKHLKNVKIAIEFATKFKADLLEKTIQDRITSLNRIITYSNTLGYNKTPEELEKLQILQNERDALIETLNKFN